MKLTLYSPLKSIQQSTPRHLRSLVLILVLHLGLITPSAFGLDSDEEEINQNPMTAKVLVPPKRLAPGEQAELQIAVELAAGYHAYVDKFKLKWAGAEKVSVGKLDISPIEKFKDTFSGKMKEGVKNRATIKAIFETPIDFALGKRSAGFQLTYQACTEKHCLFPKKIPLNFSVLISDGSLEAQASTAPASDSSGAGSSFWANFWGKLKGAATGDLSFKEVAGQGMFFSLLVIFLAGVLTSLTPCVYPMIPITLAVIGAKSKGTTRMKSFTLSIAYVLGIAVMFSSLGVFAALTGSLFGSALSHPAVVFTLASIFVLLGLSMYGAFEIQAPACIRNRLGTQGSGGYTGAVFAGLVSGIVAGPCVGPVLIGVLTHVGEKQDVVYGFSLLFSYSIGMGLLFLLLGTFSGLLGKLPRAGAWMDGSKFVFGSLMIGMALYYIKPFVSEVTFSLALGIALTAIASVYGAFAANEGLTPIHRVRKGVMVAVLSIGVFNLISALFPEQLLRMAPGASSLGTSSSSIVKEQMKKQWKNYSPELIAQSKSEGKPVIIDFWAEWCVACKELEKYTFSHKEFSQLSNQFTLVKFDATEDSSEVQRLSKKYGILGLPTVIFIDKNGEVRTDLTLTGFEEGPEFAQRMKKTLEKKTNKQASN